MKSLKLGKSLVDDVSIFMVNQAKAEAESDRDPYIDNRYRTN